MHLVGREAHRKDKTMKKIWAIRKDAEAVSPVIATILMVAITVVLAAVLYVMVLGFGGTANTPNVMILSKTSVRNGYQVVLTSPTSTAKWIDVQVQLSVGSTVHSWNLKTITWTGTSPAVGNLTNSSPALGTDRVWLAVTDLAGDGQISSGDYLTFNETGGISGSVTLTIIYTPTGSAMMSAATIA